MPVDSADAVGWRSFAEALGSLRRSALLTQEQLATRSGLSVRALRNLERGGVVPRAGSVRLLADALELSGEARETFKLLSRGGSGATTGSLATAPGPVLAQLPLDVPGFVGRAAELARLDAGLAAVRKQTGEAVVFALSGMAGVGKTALAVHWAHQVQAAFPDGQLYVNLRGFDRGGEAMPPEQALRGFLAALDVPPERVPAGVEVQAALFRSVLSGRRVLVLLDNARDADQVRPLLPGSARTLTLVTSRHQLTDLVAVEGAVPVTLDPLSAAEARELLANRLGRCRVATEPAAAASIIDECARLPLALVVVAARAAIHGGFSLAAIADEFRRARTGLAPFDGSGSGADVRTAFSLSYRALDPAAARVFRLLALHPGPDVGLPAAATMAGLPRARARSLLAELASAHLITEAVPGRFVFHDLLRRYGVELSGAVDSATERAAALERVLDHYLHAGYAAALLLDPHRDPLPMPPPAAGVDPEHLDGHAAALAWYIREHRVLLAAVEQAHRARFYRHAWQLAWTLTGYLDRRGHWFDGMASQRTALAAAENLPARHGLAHAHRYLGIFHGKLGCDGDAADNLGRALDLYGEIGDLIGQGRVHLDLGMVRERQGRRHDALDQDLRALDLFRAVGSLTGQAKALNALGWDCTQLGNHQRALDYCREALVLHQKIGDRVGEAAAWDSLGLLHHQLGQYQRAARCYDQAVSLNRALGSRYFEADTLVRLGETYQVAGDPDAADRVRREALRILDDLGHPDAARVRARP